MMTETKKTISDIAAQFDRICPSQVDRTISGNGQQEAGHIGHDNDGVLTVGCYECGGNSGEPLCEIPVDAIDTLHDLLAQLPIGKAGQMRNAVLACGGKW